MLRCSSKSLVIFSVRRVRCFIRYSNRWKQSLAISCASRFASFRSCQLISTRLRAASAAEAAGMQGKFWQMHKLIYEHQKDWKDSV